ncbi:MAG: hypothetical protein JNL30_12435 [Rubrivivax sp.]|nr:hypothetical protein [Rubrivivax sp.]
MAHRYHGVLPAAGCYYLAYGRDGQPPSHEGTLRVEHRAGRVLASGDLYVFDDSRLNEPISAGSVPAPGPGVPAFAVAGYAYHLRVTRLEPAASGFTLGFEAHRYIAHGARLLDDGHWSREGTITMVMQRAEAPPGHPSADRFYTGEFVAEPNGAAKTMRLQMGHVSSALRKAVIEIDRVKDTRTPLDNGAGVSWASVFRSFDWEVSVVDSDHDLTRAAPASDGIAVWTAADARAAMIARRNSHDLDREWRYYVVIAGTIQAPGKAHGHMFHSRREALFVGGHSLFPDEPQYGALRGQRLDTTREFFRTIVHEVGHAMGLGHNDTGFHFMRPTPVIAAQASAEHPFPGNVQWSFDEADLHALRHRPDILVRPGGALQGVEDVGEPAP